MYSKCRRKIKSIEGLISRSHELFPNHTPRSNIILFNLKKNIYNSFGQIKISSLSTAPIKFISNGEMKTNNLGIVKVSYVQSNAQGFDWHTDVIHLYYYNIE